MTFNVFCSSFWSVFCSSFRLYVLMSVCLLLCRSVHSSVCLFVLLSICLFFCLSACSSVFLFVLLSVISFFCLSVCSLVCLFVLLSVCLFFCLSVCSYVCHFVLLFHFMFFCLSVCFSVGCLLSLVVVFYFDNRTSVYPITQGFKISFIFTTTNMIHSKENCRSWNSVKILRKIKQNIYRMKNIWVPFLQNKFSWFLKKMR